MLVSPKVWLWRHKIAGQRTKSGDQVESGWFLAGKWWVVGRKLLSVNNVVGVASLSAWSRAGAPLFIRALIVEVIL